MEIKKTPVQIPLTWLHVWLLFAGIYGFAADFESLRDGGTPTAAHAVCRYGLSRENAMPGGPQTARHCSIKIIFPLFMPKAHAAGILTCCVTS